MEFHSREEAYRWSEANRFRGRQPILIRSGAYLHRFVLEGFGDRLDFSTKGLSRHPQATAAIVEINCSEDSRAVRSYCATAPLRASPRCSRCRSAISCWAASAN